MAVPESGLAGIVFTTARHYCSGQLKIANPALEAFEQAIAGELILAQVLIRRVEAGWEIRHIADCNSPAKSLRAVSFHEIRRLAQFTAEGTFRPLKSAPTLVNGWLLPLKNRNELEFALNALYPGAVADWYTASATELPVTHFREFINRQSGMYRIAAKLTDDQAGEVVNVTCGPGACLKRRMWTVGVFHSQGGPGFQPDRPDVKSVIPCLEPCALLLECARKTARAAQQPGKFGQNTACNDDE